MKSDKKEMDLSKIPGSWDELLNMKGIGKVTRMQLKMLAKLPMGKTMIDSVFSSFKGSIMDFKEKHGRDPNKKELGKILEKALGGMAKGLVTSKNKQPKP